MKRGKWIGNGGTELAVTLLSGLRVPMWQMMCWFDCSLGRVFCLGWSFLMMTDLTPNDIRHTTVYGSYTGFLRPRLCQEPQCRQNIFFYTSDFGVGWPHRQPNKIKIIGLESGPLSPNTSFLCDFGQVSNVSGLQL